MIDRKDILEGEVFVPVKTFDEVYDNYLVSNMGRCWSIKNEKFVGGINKKDGYFYVGLCKDGRQGSKMIGRLMLMSFDVPVPDRLQGIPLNKIEASHINEDKTDNRLENLIWESHKENCGRSLRRKRVGDANRVRRYKAS